MFSGEDRRSRFGTVALAAVSFASVVAAVGLLSFFSYAILRMHSVLEESLPCEQELLIESGPRIDPVGYGLYSEEEVARSKERDACTSAARELLTSDDSALLSNSVYRPLIVVTDAGAIALTLAAWTVAIASRVARRGLYALGGLTTLIPVAIGVQLRFAETIEVVTWIVD